MDESKSKLISLIMDTIDGLYDLDESSEEYQRRVSNLATLYKLKTEESRTDMEDERERAKMIRQRQENEKDRWIKIGLEGAAIVIPAILYAVFMNRGFKFEEEGVYKSKTFSNLTGRLPRIGKK